MMSCLTEEEKAKIIEEEKLRNEIRKEYEKEEEKYGDYYVVFMFLFVLIPFIGLGIWDVFIRN